MIGAKVRLVKVAEGFPKALWDGRIWGARGEETAGFADDRPWAGTAPGPEATRKLMPVGRYGDRPGAVRTPAAGLHPCGELPDSTRPNRAAR